MVLRRALAGDPEAAEMREVLQLLCEALMDRTAGQVVGDLERVVAVLSLAIPAVRTPGTAPDG
ncbi:hypothetical protein [Streptomyces anulatus]|uniref:hypothetical protein n=1 Tax=Streptomyces anulatus TaxID=1892 RepID=UPI003440F590